MSTARVRVFASLADWQRHGHAHADALAALHRLRCGLAGREDRRFQALCAACGETREFLLPIAPPEGDGDFREGLPCPACGLNARVRAAMTLLLETGLAPGARVYLTEQASPAYVWARRRFPAARGSEYRLDPERRPHLEQWLADQGAPGPIDEQDVTGLGFDDGSLDAIASFDVLEHVPDYRAALREFARCLRPGGHLLLTVPFLEDRQDTLVRARLREDGEIEHLLPPEIHGDPVSGGVLCFHHFGWDLLDAVRAAGLGQAHWAWSWDSDAAIFGMWTLLARR